MAGVCLITTVSAVAAPGPVRVVPAAPIAGRMGALAFWTGTEMIVYGGGTYTRPTGAMREFNDGAAYDPARNRWRRLATIPFGVRYGMATVWTGRHLFAWGGADDIDGRHPSPDGALYDPRTDRWTPLPPAPIGRVRASATWTGTEVVVYGGYDVATGPGRQRADGAAYDPATRTWRTLPRAPLPPFYEHTAVWTGKEFQVFTGGPRGHALAGAAYDGSAWRALPRSPLAKGWADRAIWWRDRVLLISPYPERIDGGRVRPYRRPLAPTGAFVPATGRWERLPLAPRTPAGWGPAVWTGDAVAFWTGGPRGGRAYLPAERRWIALPAHRGVAREAYASVWTGKEIIVWGGKKAGEELIPGYADGVALTPDR
ncbi:Kelch repeat-containing protein [Spongiactinospora sp. 9N601]|uniref:Kelch repeat-containing protein n=1 Tax=Spongiactinospora sp. 9N601 TaxID=3375149 RepID=UPI0037A28216